MPSTTSPTPATPTAPSDSRSRQSPSPSPTPAPPTALAPGARATMLQRIYADALAHTLKACSYDNFAACFPTPARAVPEALDTLHREFCARLGDVCRAEFANILAEKDVVASLNELDALIDEARKRSDTAAAPTPDTTGPPPHLLPPSALVAAHLSPFLADESARLESQLTGLRADNIALADDVAAQRAEIERLTSLLEDGVRVVEGAGGLFAEARRAGLLGQA